MDFQNDEGHQSSRKSDPPHQGGPRSSRAPGQSPRQQQGRDQGNRAPSGSPRSGQSEGGGNRGKSRSGSPGQQQEGREGRRRRREGGDRRGIYGFGDAIERCTCRALYHEMPDTWPVHSRSNLATLRMIEVDRRPDAILFCDHAHAGPHLWPDGEFVTSSPPAPPAEPVPSHSEPESLAEDPVESSAE